MAHDCRTMTALEPAPLTADADLGWPEPAGVVSRERRCQRLSPMAKSRARRRSAELGDQLELPAAARHDLPTGQRTTLKCVRNEPALPQFTVIGQVPSVVFPPTIHVHDTRPCTRYLALRPRACEGPFL